MPRRKYCVKIIVSVDIDVENVALSNTETKKIAIGTVTTEQKDTIKPQKTYADVVKTSTHENNKRLKQGLNGMKIGTVESLRKKIIVTSNK